MKKIILLATTLCLLLMVLVGCDTENYPSEDGLSFRATILEIHDTHVLVQTIEGMGFHHVTHVTFGTRELEDICASVGDVVNVVFTGDILETYPEQVFATSWSVVSRNGDVSGIEPIPYVGAAHETHRIVNAMPLPRGDMPLRSIQIGTDHGGFGYGAYTLTVHYDFSGDTLDYIPGEAFEHISAQLFELIENLEAVTFSIVGIEETNTDNYIYRWSISRISSYVGGLHLGLSREEVIGLLNTEPQRIVRALDGGISYRFDVLFDYGYDFASEHDDLDIDGLRDGSVRLIVFVTYTEGNENLTTIEREIWEITAYWSNADGAIYELRFFEDGSYRRSQIMPSND